MSKRATEDTPARIDALGYLMQPGVRRLIESRWDELVGPHHVAADLIEAGEPLPSPLRGWVVELLRNPPAPPPREGKRGQQPSMLLHRDAVIVSAINWLLAQHPGLKATRNNQTKRNVQPPCACSEVAWALRALGVRRLSEPAVKKIWEARASGPGTPEP
jgi:hypothetical protein